jgi:hypothetical protein
MPEDAPAGQIAQPPLEDRRTIHVLSDTPKADPDDDALDFLPYAQALAFLIDRKETATPLIIAISAPWGAGKTTLAGLVQRELRTPGDWDEPHIICSFNAWNHDDAPHLGAAFAADVAQWANQCRPLWRRIIQPLPSVMLTPEQSWRRKLYVILFALTLTVVLIFGPAVGKVVTAAAQPTGGHWTAAEHAAHGFGLSVIIFLAALAFIYPRVLSGTQAVARFIRDPKAEASQGSMATVRNQLGRLIRQATRGERRFVIFVDDLERCRPPRAVEVCEVASQLLDQANTVTVLVADMDAIAMSAAIKYRELELPDSGTSGSEALRSAYMRYGRGYLQKIVQIQFDLPPATPEQLKRMLAGRPEATQSRSRQVTPGASKTGAMAARPTSKADAKRTQRRRAVSTTIAGVVTTIAAGIAVPSVTTFLSSLLTKKGTNGASGASSWVATIATLAGVLGAAIAALALYSSIRQANRRRRARESRDKIDSEIDSTIRRQPARATVGEALEGISSSVTKDNVVSVEKRYIRAAMDPLVVRRADDLVFEFLPKRPRAAKRLLNQVRLMISIAIARGLFLPTNDEDGQKALADRVGRWLVLRERWPDVALKVENDTSLMKTLEDSARQESVTVLQSCLESQKITAVEDLMDLKVLLRKEPRLDDVSALTLLSGTSPSTIDPQVISNS